MLSYKEETLFYFSEKFTLDKMTCVFLKQLKLVSSQAGLNPQI
jgi:hypothetical protein